MSRVKLSIPLKKNQDNNNAPINEDSFKSNVKGSRCDKNDKTMQQTKDNFRKTFHHRSNRKADDNPISVGIKLKPRSENNEQSKYEKRQKELNADRDDSLQYDNKYIERQPEKKVDYTAIEKYMANAKPRGGNEIKSREEDKMKITIGTSQSKNKGSGILNDTTYTNLPLLNDTCGSDPIIKNISAVLDQNNLGIRFKFEIDKTKTIHPSYTINYEVQRERLLATIVQNDENNIITRLIEYKNMDFSQETILRFLVVDLYGGKNGCVVQEIEIDMSQVINITKKQHNDEPMPKQYAQPKQTQSKNNAVQNNIAPTKGKKIEIRVRK